MGEVKELFDLWLYCLRSMPHYTAILNLICLGCGHEYTHSVLRGEEICAVKNDQRVRCPVCASSEKDCYDEEHHYEYFEKARERTE